MGRLAVLMFCLLTGFGLAVVLLASVKGRPLGPHMMDAKRHEGFNPTAAVSQDTSYIEAGHLEGANNMPTKLVANDLFQRENPREPLSTLAAPTPPPPPPDPETRPKRWRLLHHTVAKAAGILEAEGVTLVLPGIDVVSIDEVCTTPDGVRWPCGMVARTKFRAYLRGRSMNCHLPDFPWEKTILAECLLQGQDPALWLVKNGWARARADSQFKTESILARKAALGIFGDSER